MAPIKFEEHIKEKLDEREIQASAGSWDKLDSRLNKSKKGSGRKVWISAVAAVMVLLIASLLFVNQQDQTSAPIVETPTEEKVEEASKERMFKQPVELASEENENNVKPKIQPPVKNSEEKLKISKNTIDQKAFIASKSAQKRDALAPVSFTGISGDSAVESDLSGKVQELLATISMVEKESGKTITESEVDALLAQAVKEISKDGKPGSTSGLDPDQLLAEAEEELYQSFKSKMFDVLKDGYQKAVIAVSNRVGESKEY